MKKKKIISAILTLSTLNVLSLSSCNPVTPLPDEGVIYQTKQESFWVGVGKANMTFEYLSEPEVKEENKLYGYVFNVNVSADSGKSYESWLTGNWLLSEDNKKLDLVATWKEGENSTSLVDGISGETKSYLINDNIFTIPVSLPNAGNVNFKLDIENDKVGDNITPTPDHTVHIDNDHDGKCDECNESVEIIHVDEDKDGKCDVCGAELTIDTPEVQVYKTLTATSATGQKAKIDLMDDKTWTLSVSYYDGGDFMPSAKGRWILDAAYNIELIVEKDDANILSEDTYTLAIDYTTFEYSGTIVLSIPSLGMISFNFSSSNVEVIHFEISFDLNYDGAPQLEKAKTKTFNGQSGAKEYIEIAPSVPTREGYKFAGWDTLKNPVLENGASKTEYLFGTKLSAYNSAPPSIINDVDEIKEDTTLYARWVKCIEINDENGLISMANDLNGWYKLTSDITLTKDWVPLGKYYGTYEFYESNWWLYAFHGTIDGNNHIINNMNINTLMSEDDEVSKIEGEANGNAGFIAAAVDCDIKDLTINNSSVNIANYEVEGGHIYVGTLAAFIQGANSTFTNCTVSNSNINITGTNIWYYAVGSLLGGYWGGKTENCKVIGSNTINLVTNFNKDLKRPYEAIYVGGLIGEGYAGINNSFALVNETLSINDSRTGTISTSEKYEGTHVYYGGALGSSTYVENISSEGTATLNFNKNEGAADINFGGSTGYQRYGYINNIYAHTNLILNNLNTNVVNGQKFNIGGILGINDIMYGLMGPAFFGLSSCGTIKNSFDYSSLTTTGTEVYSKDLDFVSEVPLDYMVDAYNAAFGADLSSFKRDDGSYTLFGAFSSVKIRTDVISQTDRDGNLTINDISESYGEALKSILGDKWNYKESQIPSPIK